MSPSEIKTYRKLLGWSQHQLGRALGIGRQHVSDMERGRHPIERRTELAVYHLIDRQNPSRKPNVRRS